MSKTKVSRKAITRQHVPPKRMPKNPLTNILNRQSKKESSNRVITTMSTKTKQNNPMTNMFKNVGKSVSTSKITTISRWKSRDLRIDTEMHAPHQLRQY